MVSAAEVALARLDDAIEAPLTSERGGIVAVVWPERTSDEGDGVAPALEGLKDHLEALPRSGQP